MASKAIKNFLQEVTEEIVYNIVYDAGTMGYKSLSEKFCEKTGHQPMTFFGFGNKSGKGWLDFIRDIRGLQGRKTISISDDGGDNVYTMFNATYLDEHEGNSPGGNGGISVATYREMLLTECCKMMQYNFDDLSGVEDSRHGNTPLHLVAALPGLTYNGCSLVKYLLQADVDPLQENHNQQTFLHIIFGRYMAEYDELSTLRFRFKRLPATEWFVEDRLELLDLLSSVLSPAEIVVLAKAQDGMGNTILHECAVSAPFEQEHLDDGEIYEKLLKFGASLRLLNNRGELPIHFAFSAKACRIFRRESDDAFHYATNHYNETPVLFMLKHSAALAFAQTSAIWELEQAFMTGEARTRSTDKALKLLENIITLNCSYSATFWTPDTAGDVALNVLLVAIRLASYNLSDQSDETTISYLDTGELRVSLVKLLSNIVAKATESNMKLQNRRLQSFLHALLDVGPTNNHTVAYETEILQSVKILLEHKTDVNAVDTHGYTPLDITYQCRDRNPSLYEKCAAMLTENGAIFKHYSRGEPQRKLRSCPKRHSYSAQSLADRKSQVTVVQKYRYASENPIGCGAFSVVFVAIKDENTDFRSGKIDCRAYALKRLDKAKVNPREIKREISTLLSISGKCANIINYYESFADQHFQYLSLDLMDGDLKEFVGNESVNAVLKRDSETPMLVSTQIVNGLEFLHEEKFIHRDLKPENILYTTESGLHFKISDFGLTKNVSTSSTMTSFVGSGVAMVPGTRCWMAPELISMQSKDHTQGSDVFSLGLVLHFLFTLGGHPFARRNEEPAHVIERRIAEMEIQVDRTLPPEAVSFLRSLLMKNPAQRPPAASLKYHPFLWSESKKIEFLIAVGDQKEARTPSSSPMSELERRLQMTETGQDVLANTWDQAIKEMFQEMCRAWKRKKYRTDKVIDLVRFIRNAYAHKQERSPEIQGDIEVSIFLRKFPSLVLDVFGVVQQLNLHESRSNIHQVFTSD